MVRDFRSFIELILMYSLYFRDKQGCSQLLRAGSEGNEREKIIDVVCGARFSIIFTVSGSIVICDHGGNPKPATSQLVKYLQGAKSESPEQSSFDLPEVAFVSVNGQLYIRRSDG